MLPKWYIEPLMATAFASLSSPRIEDMRDLSARVSGAALRRVIIIP